MKNRFAIKGEQRILPLPHIKIIYIMCPVLVIIFMLSLSSISNATISRQRDSLETALNRDIIHCYAVEGFYPPSLEYVEEHYGLTFDKDLFFVDYQPIGSNIRPDITIIVRQ